MFDKDRFSDILKDIILQFNSLRDFSNECNVNRTTISKLVRKELENPPKPDILKKIADNSKGVTTYEELMEVCGYFNLPAFSTSILKKKIDGKFISYRKKLSKFLTEEQINELYDIINNQIFNSKESSIDCEEITNFADKNNLSTNYKMVLYSFGVDLLHTASIEVKKLIKFYSSIKKDFVTQSSSSTHQTKTVKIPVLGSIPAGIPIELIEDIIDYEDISEEMLKGGKEYFALKVKGSSMWPKYLDGDTIIVLKQDDCESGQDAIVMVNGDDGTFKRVIKKNNGITLEPINQQEYNSVSYTNKEILQLPVKILGIVKEIRRKI